MKCERCEIPENEAKYNVNINRLNGKSDSLFEYDLHICEECAREIAEHIDY